tara:strand:- start:2395 stop:2739 length:345 start_codon:yes stop_codon:yes gene_type:complete
MICVPDDNFYDERAEMDSDTINDIEEDRILNTIIKFKDFIVKEPEFYAIKNISSFRIFKIIQSSGNNVNSNIFPDNQLIYISELISDTIGSSKGSDINFIKNVYTNLYEEMYII